MINWGVRKIAKWESESPKSKEKFVLVIKETPEAFIHKFRLHLASWLLRNINITSLSMPPFLSFPHRLLSRISYGVGVPLDPRVCFPVCALFHLLMHSQPSHWWGCMKAEKTLTLYMWWSTTNNTPLSSPFYTDLQQMKANQWTNKQLNQLLLLLIIIIIMII